MFRPRFIVHSILLLFCCFALRVGAQAPVCTFSKDGHLERSCHNIFDNKDRLANSICYTYNEQGIVETRSVESYDTQQRLTQRNIYTADDELLLEETMKYDNHNNLVKRTQYFYEGDKCDKVVEKRSYEYNADGAVAHCRYYLNGELYYEF